MLIAKVLEFSENNLFRDFKFLLEIQRLSCYFIKIEKTSFEIIDYWYLIQFRRIGNILKSQFW